MIDDTFSDMGIDSIKEKSESIQEEIQQDIEERKKSSTKTGRKSKEAKQAETEEILIGMLEQVLTGANAILVRYVGEEMNHEETEIKTISHLSAPVISKHVDIENLRYKEEMALVSYLMMAEIPKLEAVTRRMIKDRKKQKKEKREPEESEQE